MPNSANRSKDQSNIEQPKRKATEPSEKNAKAEKASNKQDHAKKNSREQTKGTSGS